MRYQTFLFGEHAIDPLREIVVFDLETTGFSPQNHEIIQIAAAKLIGGRVGRQQTFSTYVKPSGAIPPKITAKTGIDRSHVRKAPRIDDALAAFSDFCGDGTLVGHNSHSFDMPFVRNACLKIGCLTRQVVYFDSMHLSWFVWGKRPGTGHSLDRVMQRCAVVASKFRRHDARGDVTRLARCIQKMFCHINSVERKSVDRNYHVQLHSGVLPVSGNNN